MNGWKRLIAMLAILVLVGISLCAKKPDYDQVLRVTNATYFPLQWEYKPVPGISSGNVWAAKVMTFTVANTSNERRNLIVVTSNSYIGDEARVSFTQFDKNHYSYQCRGYFVLLSEGKKVFSFNENNTYSNREVLYLNGNESRTFDVWHYFDESQFTYSQNWDGSALLDTNPKQISEIFRRYTTVLFHKIPWVTLTDYPWGVSDTNEEDKIGHDGIQTLEFPGINTINNKKNNVYVMDTVKGNNVIFNIGSSVDIPEIWEMSISQTDSQKTIQIADLESRDRLSVGSLLFWRESGASHAPVNVTIQFTPSDFYFADPQGNIAFYYDLWCEGSSVSMAQSPSSYEWKNLAPVTILKPYERQLSISYPGKASELDLLVAGNYTSTVRINFVTGD